MADIQVPLKKVAPSSAMTTASSSSLTTSSAVSPPNGAPPQTVLSGSPLDHLPSHVQELLLKANISPAPCCLSPYRCVLFRHPVHRDTSETHVASLVASIRQNGFNQNLAFKSPLVAIRYTRPASVPTRAAGTTRATVTQNWGDHPLVYVLAGAGRGEAIGQLVRSDPDHPNIKSEQKGLGFYLLNNGENLTPWEVFLLSVSLNSVDPDSRPPNYFERTDQIAFICWEISNRKGADATLRDIAVEICFNPFLNELRNHLKLHRSIVPLLPIVENLHPPEVLQQLFESRKIFPCLPAAMGVLVEKIPFQPLESLDVLIDMAACVNANRMKRLSPEAAQAKQKEALEGATTEGFLHTRAEDQLRQLFKEIVPLQAGSSFDVLVIRDLVGIVFAAIQECSRQFKQSAASRSADAPSVSDSNSATSAAAGAYWIERIVFESNPGGMVAGLWNFPAAALIVLFYVYFVNGIQQFERATIQENILRFGTVLYRCVAELALTLRSCKVTLFNANAQIQLRVLEAASLLFRMALFGSVRVEMFPPFPFKLPAAVLHQNSQTVYEVRVFTDMDQLYEFIYSYWLQGVVIARLPPISNYRVPQPVNPTPDILAPPVATPPAAATTARPRPWFESRRMDVAATVVKLRSEAETAMAGVTPGLEKVKIKRTGKRTAPGSPGDGAEIEVVDPSILPMAQPARLEFLALVYGVTSMLLEKHQCLENVNVAMQVQILGVPSNMIILAAIKVALTFVPPHFDRLAPFLVNWLDVRCRLMVWMWRTSKLEVCKRTEEKFAQIWAAQGSTGPVPKLEIRVLSQRSDGRPAVELTLSKLSEVVKEIVPDVLKCMSNFYEDHSSLPDDRQVKEFFANWLKTTGDGDLIARVNALLIKPSPPQLPMQYADLHLAKKARAAEALPRDYLRLAMNNSPSIATGHPTAQKQSPLLAPMRLTEDRGAGKRPRRPLGRGGEADELADWLDSLPYTERSRLDLCPVPSWEVARGTDMSLPDLLRWRPPELLQPYSGNGLKGPPSNPVKLKFAESIGSQPLSDVDWKVIQEVLKLLKSRGVDTLVSRGRGQVFFLDQVTSRPEIAAKCATSDEEEEEGRKPKHKAKRSAVDIAAQKRYGSSFFRNSDPLVFGGLSRTPDADQIRSFLEMSE